MSETVTCEKACINCGTRFTAKMSKLLEQFPVPVRVFKAEPRRCPACQDVFQQQCQAKALRRLLNFTQDQVKKHFNTNPPAKGDTLILAMQQFHTNNFRLVKVANPDSGRQHRIIIEPGCCYGGASYYRTGQSTYSPKGQTVLRPLVPAVAERLSYDRDTTLSDEDLLDLMGE